MEELLALLFQLHSNIESQTDLFSELIPILDSEEQLIAGFQMGEFEALLSRKDALVQRLQVLEKSRQSHLGRLLFLMSVDSRKQLPSLRELLVILESYVSNVTALLRPDLANQLLFVSKEISGSAAVLLNLYQTVRRRIGCNQLVLQKVATNMQRSFALLQGESHSNYDAKARQGALDKGISSVRIKV